MKRELAKDNSWNGDKASLLFRKDIVGGRLVLCIIIVSFAFANPATGNLKAIIIWTIFYFALNISFGYVHSLDPRLKRWRVLPDLIDIIFISLIINYFGGPSNSWFLLYLFPILSASRYLGYLGCIGLAITTVIAYAILNFYVEAADSLDSYSFALRSLGLVAVATVAGNLAYTKQGEEKRLIEAFDEIVYAILSDLETDQVLSLTLRKAIEFTNSDIGQLHLLPNKTREAKILTVVNELQRVGWNMDLLTERFYQRVIESKKPLFIKAIKGSHLKDIDNPLRTYWIVPKSALLVPLTLDDKIIGIIAVYSKNKFHYTRVESTRLGGVVPLIAMAQRHRELYKKLAASAEERKDRLKMLHTIAEKLRAEQGLFDLFNRVVELIYKSLNSEEAALFITYPNNLNLIRKVAVASPSERITEYLQKVEETYSKGQSLTGKVFETQESMAINNVSPDEKHADDYLRYLPSKKINHYMGVPLIIGNDVLGVIRVLNKKGSRYSLRSKMHELSDEGFNGEEDLELLKIIATQVASAIRNAEFIETHRYFKNLFDNSPDPIIVLDEEGKVQQFNSACEQLWGIKAKDAIGRRVDEFYESTEHAKELGRSLWKSTDHIIQNIEARVKHPKGEIIPISLSASLIFDKEGKPIGSLGIFKDLREIKKLQEDITRAEKLAAIGKLAQTVGHDIKHDIAIALNFLEPLSFQNANVREKYPKIRNALMHAVHKLQNMLDASRVKTPIKHRLRVESIFRMVETAMQEQSQSRKIDFSAEYPKGNYYLEADSDQIRQVLSNLFFNSIHAVEKRKGTGALQDRGFIRVSAQIQPPDLFMRWEDNGCGIPRENISRIFTPFFTNKETGNGLGLFIVKSIIENHNGKISVRSEIDKGTCFEIMLPLHVKADLTDQDDLKLEGDYD